MAISKVPSSGITADFDNSLTTADLAPNSVDSSELVDGSIDTSHIADDAVTGAKLANDIAITTTGALTGTTGDFNWDSNTLVVDSSASKVGVGVADPHTALEVNGSISCGDTQATPSGALYVRHTHASEYVAHIENVSAEKGHGLKVASNANENDEYILTCLNGAGTTALCATGAGKVGIGTVTPNVPLHINGFASGLPVTSGTAQTYGAFRLQNTNSNTLDFGFDQNKGAWIQTGYAPSLITANTYSLLLNPNGGKVGIGTTTPTGGTLHVAGNVRQDGFTAFYNTGGGTLAGYVGDAVNLGAYPSAGGYCLQLRSAGVLYFSHSNNSTSTCFLYTNGDFYTNDGTVSSASDKRVKKDVNDLSDGIDIIEKLRPVTFKYNNASKTTEGYATTDALGSSSVVPDKTRFGFIADEVLDVAPQYVEINKGEINGEEVDDYKSMAPARMIPMIVKAIQELSAKVTALENA